MRSHALARLLLSLPDLEVTTWDAGHREPHAVEQVLADEQAVVLGMEISAGPVTEASVVWTAHDLARCGLDNARAEWARARREWVG